MPRRSIVVTDGGAPPSATSDAPELATDGPFCLRAEILLRQLPRVRHCGLAVSADMSDAAAADKPMRRTGHIWPTYVVLSGDYYAA